MIEAMQEKKQNKASSRSKTLLEEKQQRLLQLLRSGLMVVSPLWNYPTRDWVTSVYAADIDNDGDIEIIIGSYDGSVRVLTTAGGEKWRVQLGLRISAMAVISQPDDKTKPSAPRIITGSREGKVCAINQNGQVIEDWQYDVGQVVRQIYIDPEEPERVIIAAEDQCVHVLDSTTSNLLWPYKTQGRVLCVFSYDVDNDGEREVLAGSSDKNVYILSTSGKLKGSCNTECKVYSVSATRLSSQEGEPVTILTSANGKNLCGWTMAEQPDTHAKQLWQQTWPQQKDPEDILFENRLHAIQALDINRDGKKEILVGSEDKHLYILDHQGHLLWKHYVGYRIYSLYAIDFNYDGIIEVILGLEDNNVQVLRVELVPDLYQTIRKQYKAIKQREAINLAHDNRVNAGINDPGMSNTDGKHSLNGSIDTLWQLQPEKASALSLLSDLLGEQEDLRPYGSMELAVAQLKKYRGEYEDALTILLMLKEKHVQHCWPYPRNNLGHIRWLAFGDVQGDRTDEIIVSDEDGIISALDIKQQDKKKALLWQQPRLEKSVLALQMGRTNDNDFDTIYTVLVDHRVFVLKSDGTPMLGHEPTLRDKTDQVCCIYIDVRGKLEVSKIHEIILGLENNKIYIYDDSLKKRRATIHTEAAIKLICAHDINGDGEAEIIFGSVDHQVYAYARNGEKLWNYPTQDHVRAICAEDVDKDGYVEIIVGSEDHNVYVLDWQGQLKWRYYAPHRILDVDVCNFDGNGEYSILLGVADGYMYVLNPEGDLRWSYKTNGRVYAVHAKDLNDDKKIEIALASEDRLDLLQVASADELDMLINECWDELKKQRWNRFDEQYWKAIDEKNWKDREEKHNSEDLKQTLHHYAQPDQNEYLRSFALPRLAGQRNHTGQSALNTDDFKVFREALKSNSLIIKKSLVRVVANLCKSGNKKREVRALVRQLLQQLFNDPNREIRLAIINMLEYLVDSDKALGFEYLERFKNNADVWVRRMLVRKLSHLCKDHPEQAFRLLYMMAKDEHSWIRQETGRSLAHYFDLNTSELINGSHQLLAERIDPTVLAQIASSAKEVIVKQYYSALKQLLEDPNSAEFLDEVLVILDTASKQELPCSKQTLLLYQELRQLLAIKNVPDIEHYQRSTNAELIMQIHLRLAHLKSALEGIGNVINIIGVYRRREALSDRVISLIEATLVIDKLHRDIDKTIAQCSPESSSPEDAIMATVLQQWHKIMVAELRHLRGAARLEIQLKDRVVRYEEEVEVSLSISNKGRSPADNISISLEENEKFEIVGSDKHFLKELTTTHPESFGFTIKPNTDAPMRLSLVIIYDDAERKDKKIHFADRLEVQSHNLDRPFEEISSKWQDISNPYSSGMAIRNEKMFYGRKDDNEFLRDALTSTDVNRVVVLTGQRRLGKTSLIYYLANRLSPHIPVFIDIQSLSLKNVSQLITGLATRIDEALKKWEVIVPMTDAQEFEKDPTEAFDKYLAVVTQTLIAMGRRLVLLIDEFDDLRPKIAEGQIDRNFLQYLRSLMQHCQGINFLLAGAPAIRQLTEDYWAVFFNIAQHRKLSKLRQEDAIALITEPVHQQLTYDPLAIEKMCYLTGGQPNLIHIMCEAIIRYCNKRYKTYVTINDVNMIVGETLGQDNAFGWVWGLATPAERFVLSILSQEEDETYQGQTGFFSLIDIRQGYDRQGIPFELESVLALLRHLVQEDILEERLNGTQFRIPVGLIRAWWHMNYPIERVLREGKLEVS